MRARAAAMILLIASGTAEAGPRAPETFARLEAALREHPRDVALARALARAQLDAGLHDAALATIEEQIARAPEQRGSLAQLRGRVLYARGELLRARSALLEAIAHRGTDALAYFYLGLTEQRLGNRLAAERALTHAQRLDPLLESRVRAASLPPATALGRVAERVTLFGLASLDYDTNTTLEGEEATAGTPGGPSDGLLGYQAGIAARLLDREDARAALTYRYDAMRHRDVDALDLQSQSVSLAGAVALSPTWIARLDGGAGFHRLDGAKYLETGSLAGGVARRGESGGLLELLALAERRSFANEPALPSLERDGWRVGTALRHARGFRWGLPALVTSQLSYVRTLTEGSRDLFGFGPAYDSQLAGIDVGLRVALPYSVRLDSQLRAALENFDSRNVVDFLTHPSATGFEADRRRDRVVEASLGVARPIGSWLELELHARETRHFSNIDLYDWERQIVGTTLRVFWQPRTTRSRR